MADSKYAGLPGIITDQPDTYESSDLPESEQQVFHDALDSTDSVEELHISHSEAHAKFADKHLIATRVNCSDGVAYKNKSMRRIEWSLAADMDSENMVEKYNRLMCEVSELQKDILTQKEQGNEIPIGEAAASGQGEAKETSYVSAVQLERQVEELQKQLLHVQLDAQSVGAVVAPHQKLQALIDQIKQAKNKTPATTEGASGSDGLPGLSYQLLYQPALARPDPKAAALETRISKLEALLGNDQDKLNRLYSWTRSSSLVGAVGCLGSKMALLEPEQLSQVEGRVAALATRLGQLGEKKDQEKERKIGELYDVVQKCDAMCVALPEVIERLAALQGLHQQASAFSTSLRQLAVTQTEVGAQLSGNEELLGAVRERFAQNLATIQGNIESLDARIKALDKKK